MNATTFADDGTETHFLNATFGPIGDELVSVVVRVIVPPARADGNESMPCYFTQPNHLLWAQHATSRGFVGVVYPGGDTSDAAPAFRDAYDCRLSRRAADGAASTASGDAQSCSVIEELLQALVSVHERPSESHGRIFRLPQHPGPNLLHESASR